MAMDTVKVVVLCGVVVLATVITPADGCSCFPTHPQQIFCDADFAIKAKVVQEDLISDIGDVVFDELDAEYRRYTVRIFKLFKEYDGLGMVVNADFEFIYTHASSATCGVYLAKGPKYILTGSVYDGKAHIALCGIAQPENSFTSEQKKGFKGKYDCDCQIESCLGADCEDNTGPDACFLGEFNAGSYCYMNYSRCERDSDGECDWTSPCEFALCQESGRP